MNKKFIKIFFLAILFLGIFALAKNSEAATYYVKNGGNDSLAGTSDETAWETIAKVQSIVQSGDTVYFNSGDTWEGTTPVLVTVAGVIYDGSTYGTGARATIKATAAGAAQHGCVDIYNSNVTFKGFDVDNNNIKTYTGIAVGSYAAKSIENIVIDNCLVHDVGDPLVDDWMYGIHLGIGGTNNPCTLRNVSITNTDVYDVNHEGIAIYSPWGYPYKNIDTVLVRNCNIYNTGLSKDGAGIGIAIVNDADNVTLEYNNIHNNHTGVWMRISPFSEGDINITSGPNNAIIRNNLIYDNIYSGINAAHSPRGYTISGDFYGNVLWDNGIDKSLGSGITIGGDFANPASAFNIYNNTIYNETGTASNYLLYLQNYHKGASTTEINLKNNIFFSTNYPAIWDFTRTANLDHSNNLIYRSSGVSDTAVTSISSASTSMPSATVTVTIDSSNLTFTKTDDGTDWTSLLSGYANGVEFSGFSSTFLNNKTWPVVSVTANQIKTTVATEPKVAVDATGTADSDVSGKIYIFNNGNFTYFAKNVADDSSDWRTKAHAGGTVTWSGFPNSNYNGTFTVSSVAANYISVPLIQEFNETSSVSVSKYTYPQYNRSTISNWEESAEKTNPNFTGGTLPTGFSGTYGTNMVPNTNYFSIESGDAIDNGVTLGSPYNSSINGAGLASPLLRTAESYDIGAYEFVELEIDVTPPNAPTGLAIN